MSPLTKAEQHYAARCQRLDRDAPQRESMKSQHKVRKVRRARK